MLTAVRSSLDADVSVGDSSGLFGDEHAELFQISLALGSHTDRLAVRYLPKHHPPDTCASPPHAHGHLPLHILSLPYTSCCQPLAKARLLLCSWRRGRTCSTRHYILLGSVLLQHDPQHHLSSLFFTTVTYVTAIAGEQTSTVLLPSCLVNMASCCCSLLNKASSDLLSTQVSTRSSAVTVMSVLLVGSRAESWSEETQSYLPGAGNPICFPDTLSLGCKRSVEMVLCPKGWYLISVFFSANCCD